MEVPRNGDAYILSQIVHDWNDNQSVAILKMCRRAITRPEDCYWLKWSSLLATDPDFGKLLDLHMLALVGGRQRTQSEYRDLLAEAGFQVTRVVPTAAGASIVEAVSV